jgi:hypothetical protein
MRKAAFWVYVINGIIGAIAYGGLTQQQALKLCDAARKISPESMDITYYRSRQDFSKSEQDIRKLYEKIAFELDGPEDHSSVTPEERSKFIEHNVNRYFTTQKEGNKSKFHICYDKSHQRVDYGEYAASKTGSASEPLQDTNASYKSTYIIVPNGQESITRHFTYNDQGKPVLVQTSKGKGGLLDSTLINMNVTTMPANLIKVIKTELGDEGQKGIWEPNEAKIKLICNSADNDSPISVETDPNSPQTRVKIEIISCNSRRKPFAKSIMICDKNDYSIIYDIRNELSSTGDAINIETRSNFDTQGFPHNITSTEYDNHCQIKQINKYTVQDVVINRTIPDTIFRFDPNEYDIAETPAQ